jgi:hypothetical protein
MDLSNAGQDYQNYQFSSGILVLRKEKYYGFNELERRKDDLCQFLKTDCDASPGVTEIFLLINKNMLNPDIH